MLADLKIDALTFGTTLHELSYLGDPIRDLVTLAAKMFYNNKVALK